MIKYNKFVITSKFVAHQHFKECHEVLKKKRDALTNCWSSILLFFRVQKRHNSTLSHISISRFPSNYYLSPSIDLKEYQ